MVEKKTPEPSVAPASVEAQAAPAAAPAPAAVPAIPAAPVTGGAPSFLAGPGAGRVVALTIAAVLVVMAAVGIGFMLGNGGGDEYGRMGMYEQGQAQSGGYVESYGEQQVYPQDGQSVYPQGGQGGACASGSCATPQSASPQVDGSIPNPACPSGSCTVTTP